MHIIVHTDDDGVIIESHDELADISPGDVVTFMLTGDRMDCIVQDTRDIDGCCDHCSLTGMEPDCPLVKDGMRLCVLIEFGLTESKGVYFKTMEDIL